MKISPVLKSSAKRLSRRAFSLIEVLLAIFILGIGMIMVASVFPVGADWTRQATEQSIAQSIALNAVSVIQKHYDLRSNPTLLNPVSIATPPTSFNTIFFSYAPPTNAVDQGSPFFLQPLPLFAATVSAPNAPLGPVVPVTERAYQFGNTLPFPALNPLACTYFWTALVRLNPIHRDPSDPTGIAILPASSYKYDLYILVFRKGAVEQTFGVTKPLPSGYTEMNQFNFMRNLSPHSAPFENYIPSMVFGSYNPGTYNASATPNIVGAVPPIGCYGIGLKSGTVFRQGLNLTIPPFPSAIPRPMLQNDSTMPNGLEPVIFAPAADGTTGGPAPFDNPIYSTASPLVYIYQTTISE